MCQTRILVVEDHEDSAHALKRLMELLGHEVTVCRCVANAKQAAAETPFDLVISDLTLPDGTGQQLMSHLRDAHAIPGLALTGHHGDEVRRSCREAGFSNVLFKPVRLEELEAAIVKFTQKSHCGV